MFRQLLKRRGLLFAFLLLPPSALAVPAGSAEKAPRIEVSSPCDKFPRNSISPARVLIENVPNGKDTHTLEFQTLWNDNSRQRYSFSVPPGQTRQAVIYPSMTDSQLLYRNSADESISLFAASEDAPFFAVLQEKTPSEWNMLSDSPFNAQVNTFDLMDWPADYRMYAAQNCIIIPEKLYESYLDEPHRKALRQWVLGGGSLWLIGDRGRNINAVPLGRGLILHVPSLEGLTDKEKEAALLKLKTETKDIFPVKVDGYYQTRLHPKVPDASPYFFTTPSFLLGLILVAFAVLVGPVCLLRWAPVGKRQRLFILIPAISLGVSILLAAVILIGDGTGGRGSRAVHILVNPQDHTGLITQSQVCQTLILTNNEFTLPEDVHLQGCRLEEEKFQTFHEDGYVREKLENYLREGNLCSGGWFTSRSTLEHKLVRPITTRASVTVIPMPQPDGAPVLQSTFPGALSNLIYRDASGTYWRIPNLPPGERKTAVRSEKIPSETPPPGHFHAEMISAEGELGPIPTLDSIKWENTRITVSGPAAGNQPLPQQP